MAAHRAPQSGTPGSMVASRSRLRHPGTPLDSLAGDLATCWSTTRQEARTILMSSIENQARRPLNGARRAVHRS